MTAADVDYELPSRILDPTELEPLVARVAREPDRWRDLVHHDPSQRIYEQLFRTEHVGVWLICWMHDHDTGFHDHDLSSGAVGVAEGAVREERLVLNGSSVERVLSAGETFSFLASDIHRVMHAGEIPAVTIHAYSPPLWRMGAYHVGADGTLRRESVSYAEELRPVDQGPF
jgi:predicted metal-dependent enzyme (double-stranded beta helix superfamily)